MILAVTVQYTVPHKHDLHIVFLCLRHICCICLVRWSRLLRGIVRFRLLRFARLLCIGQGLLCFIRVRFPFSNLHSGFRAHIRVTFQLIPLCLQFLYCAMILFLQCHSFLLHPDLNLSVDDLDQRQNTETDHHQDKQRIPVRSPFSHIISTIHPYPCPFLCKSVY